MNFSNLTGLNLTKPINLAGGTNTSIQAKKFEDDLRVVLMTKKGTLIGDPDFGSDLYRYLFEPASELTASLIRDEIKLCIEKYFTNVSVKRIDVGFLEYTVKLKIYYSLYVLDNEELLELEFRKVGE